MPTPRFHLNLVGDVMLGRLIDQLLPTHIHCPEEAEHNASFAAGNPSLKSYGLESPWGNTLPLVHSADLNLINLETAVTTHPSLGPTRRDPREACRPAVLGLEDGNEDYTVYVYSASDHPSEWSAVPKFHLVDYLPATRQRLKQLLTSAAVKPDLKVFSIHWGPNYSWTPADEIQSLARFLIDECGVDVIHGHSSHHIQGVEIYKSKLIIYGCGDFVDDYAVKPQFRNDLSAVWRVAVDKKGGDEGQGLRISRLEVFPGRIKHFQAKILDKNDPDHEWVKKRFGTLCEEFGIKIQEQLGEQSQIEVDIK